MKNKGKHNKRINSFAIAHWDRHKAAAHYSSRYAEKQMRHIKLLLPVLLALTTGCTIGMTTLKEESKIMRDGQFELSKERGILKSIRYDFDEPRILLKNQIIEAWGEPDGTEKSDNKYYTDIIIYDKYIGYSGVIPILILPLPLVAPTGYRSTYFYLKDDKALKAKEEYTDVKTDYCFWLLLMYCKKDDPNFWF